jgi:hypothetical protein
VWKLYRVRVAKQFTEIVWDFDLMFSTLKYDSVYFYSIGKLPWSSIRATRRTKLSRPICCNDYKFLYVEGSCESLVRPVALTPLLNSSSLWLKLGDKSTIEVLAVNGQNSPKMWISWPNIHEIASCGLWIECICWFAIVKGIKGSKDSFSISHHCGIYGNGPN